MTTQNSRDLYRKNIRFRNYDYSSPGVYFVTIVTRNRIPLFGNVEDGIVALSEIGKIVDVTWNAIPGHSSEITLDAFVIMPNHIHGILVLNEKAGAAARPTGDIMKRAKTGSAPGSLNAIIQNFKSVSTRRINQQFAIVGRTVWQPNYYEHVIRNDDEWQRVRDYIAANPYNWDSDPEKGG